MDTLDVIEKYPLREYAVDIRVHMVFLSPRMFLRKLRKQEQEKKQQMQDAPNEISKAHNFKDD